MRRSIRRLSPIRRPPRSWVASVRARRLGDRDPEAKAARIGLEQAREHEDKIRRNLADAKRQLEKVRLLYEKARKLADEGRSRELEAQRLLEEARRKVVNARRRGESLHRWQSDERRWEDEQRRAAQDTQRWGDEARRKETEYKTLDEEIRNQTEELERLTKQRQNALQRLESTRLRKTVIRPKVRTAGPTQTLEITTNATAALKDTLDGMSHEPSQALRLNIDPGGSISLSLDYPRASDNVIKHLGVTVLLIRSPLPPSLLGSTLDVNYSAGAPSFVLSR